MSRQGKDEAAGVTGVALFLQEENNRLLRVIEDLQKREQDNKRDLKKLVQEKVTLQQSFDEKKEKEQSLQTENDHLRKEVREKTAKLKEKDKADRKEKEELKSEVQKLKTENSRLLKEMEEMTAKQKEKTKSDRKEREDLKNEERKLKKELATLHQKMEESPFASKERERVDTGVEPNRKQTDEEQKLKEEIRVLHERVKDKDRKLTERDEVYVRQSKQLRENLEKTQAELADLRQRLTRMASARIRAGNTALEDLSDTNRPSQLVLKWQNLFTSGEYWVVYEQVRKKLDDFSSTWLMYELCKNVYDTCVDFADRLKKVENVAIRAWLENSGDSQQRPVFWQIREQLAISLKKHLHYSGEFTQAFNKMSMTESEMDKLKDDLVEMCVRHMEKQAQNSGPEIRRCILQQLAQKPPPEALLQSIYSNLHHQLSGIIEVHHYEDFVKQVYSLCYRMLTMEIPMAVRFDAGAGSVFDPSLYENEDPEVEVGEESVINLVLRPPVLRYDGGPVLVKGLAQVLQGEEDKGSKPGTSPSARQGEASSPGRHTQGARGGPPAGDGNLDASPDETDETDEDGVGLDADRGTGGGDVSNDRRAERDGNNGDEDDENADEPDDDADNVDDGTEKGDTTKKGDDGAEEGDDDADRGDNNKQRNVTTMLTKDGDSTVDPNNTVDEDKDKPDLNVSNSK